MSNKSDKVFIRKTCGKGRFGVGYVIFKGMTALDEIVTASNYDSQAAGNKLDREAGKSAGGFNLIRAAVLAARYAGENKLPTTPFISKVYALGDAIVTRTDNAVKIAATHGRAAKSLLAVLEAEGKDVVALLKQYTEDKSKLTPDMVGFLGEVARHEGEAQAARDKAKELKQKELTMSRELEKGLSRLDTANGEYHE